MKTKKQSTLFYFLAGALIGAFVFLLIYGFSALDVTNDSFLRGGYVEQDIQQHYAGWLFYREAPLSLPFCVAPGVNWPDGLSVAFTDSIPLFAAFFRLLSPLLPEVFQYFGLFTLLCLMLQGGFAALLMHLFTEKWPLILLGVLPFVFSPILLERAFRHTSLAAHFLILAALYYYMLSLRQNRFAYAGLFVINCLTISIHPYFVPMTFAVTFALLLEYALRNRSWLRPFGWLAANLAGCLATGWLFGFFGGAGSGSGGSGISYGHFSMNLNALWNPSSLGYDWSLLLPIQNQLPGNYDGFNYLGLGMLTALAAALLFTLLFCRDQILPLLRRHWGLIFVCACLTVFAVSNTVTANGAVLLRLPLPQVILNLATTLRSSGRMFWLVYYLLFLFAIRGLLLLGRNLPIKQAGAFLLAVLCCVQLADLSPALMQKSRSLREYQPVKQDLVTGTTPELCTASDFFARIEGRYHHLIALDPLTHTGLNLALYAADTGMTSSDTSFAARFNEEAAARRRQLFLEEILSGELPSDSLFLTENEDTFLSLADTASAAGAWCGALQADRGNGAETILYAIAPGLAGETFTLSLAYSEDFPFHLADLTDDYWDHGVLSLNLEQIDREEDKNRVVIFHDNPFIRRKLESAHAISADGVTYPVLDIDDSDAGWLMVTLDTPDACILMEKDLRTVS